MSKQTINIGTAPNDGTGDTIRDAFHKCNDNFTELYNDDAADTLDGVTTRGNTTTNSITVGGLIVDTNTLYVDSTNNSVGIGTTSPTAPLDVRRSDTSGIVAEFHNNAGYGVNIDVESDGGVNTIGSATNQALAFVTNGGSNERMRIDIAGNVGINTASPSVGVPLTAYYNSTSQFHFGGAQGGISNNVYLDTSVTAYRNRNTGAGGALLQLSTDGSFSFRRATSGSSPTLTYSMYIDGSGNVGIGSTSPSQKLTVVGNISTTGSVLFNDNQGINFGDSNARIYGSSADGIKFNGSGSEKMRLTQAGNLGINTSSPSTALEVNNASAGATVATFEGTYSASGDVKLASFERTGGAVAAAISYVDASTSMKFGTTTSHSLSLTTGDTARLTIDNSGNVGIGTASPDFLLTLEGSTATPALKIKDTTNGVTLLAFSQDANSHIGTYSNHSLVFDTNSAEAMRIDSSGNILVAKQALNISTVGTELRANGQSLFTCDGNNPIDLNRLTDQGGIAIFRQASTVVGNISVTSSATSYNTSSDYRLKENVVPMEGALDRVAQLKPSRFNFIADSDKTVDGFLAHEVAEVIPEAITGEKDAVDEEGNAIHQGIDQSKIVPLLVGAIQELKAEIETLKSQINK